eukprot:c10575_g1_i2.p1 GENE.c10575_g1_i2~~c10575_g1_i2.p1  ORF type:complete len:274 (-),score=62.91 c10575_g1_i2:105-926(-)
MCATKSNTIQKIESLLNYIIQYNSHQSRINCVTSIQSSHNSPFTEPWEHETITFEQFTQETSVLATFDDQCYIYAFSLLKKIELHHQLVLITQQTVHRLFFACLVLAFKFMQDGRYADSEFAMLGGFRSQMLISMQIWIFKALKFNCFIDKKSFQLMGSRLRKLDLSLQSNSYSNYNNEPQFMTLSWLLERKEVTGQFTQHQHQHHSQLVKRTFSEMYTIDDNESGEKLTRLFTLTKSHEDEQKHEMTQNTADTIAIVDKSFIAVDASLVLVQ